MINDILSIFPLCRYLCYRITKQSKPHLIPLLVQKIKIKWEIRKMIYYIRALIWKHITFMFAVNISKGIIEKLRIFLDYDEPKLICQWLCFTKNIFHTIRVHIFPRHCLLWLIVSILHLIMPVTHLPLDKMAAILADDIFKCICLNENDRFRIPISLKSISSGSVNNKRALVRVMAWRRIGDKPLPETMMTRSTNAYMWH